MRRGNTGSGSGGGRHRSGPPRRAFSLLEMVLALSLIIMLMGGVYGFYVSTMQAREAAVRSMRDTLLMRALLEQMAEEIRHVTDIVPDNVGFIGTEEELTFTRLAIPHMGEAMRLRDRVGDDSKPGLQDFLRVTYKLEWDTSGENLDEDGTPVVYGLLRNSPPLIDPNPAYQLSPEALTKLEEDTGFKLDDGAELPRLPPSAPEIIAPEVKYLRFKYFDGVNWLPRWQATGGSAQQASGGDAGTGELGDGTGGTGDQGAGGDGSDLAAGLGGEREPSDRVLPQAIQITIGKVKVPHQLGDFDIGQAMEEERLDNETWHPDRWTIRVYLRQADQSLLSTRSHGIDVGNDLGIESGQLESGLR
ncbi:MAG: hypothetical protein HY718_16255 [Planctomycetes bacterium]|nr:hypothetical protein [Planctomycetota bacterium]